MSLQPFLNRVNAPDFRLSPRAQRRVEFTEDALSTPMGRAGAVALLVSILLSAGIVAYKKVAEWSQAGKSPIQSILK